MLLFKRLFKSGDGSSVINVVCVCGERKNVDKRGRKEGQSVETVEWEPVGPRTTMRQVHLVFVIRPNPLPLG